MMKYRCHDCLFGWEILKRIGHLNTVNVSSMNKRTVERGRCSVGKKGLKEQVRAHDEEMIKKKEAILKDT